MTYFLALLLKILPLYVLIAIGYIASKKKDIKENTISSLLIYVIAPGVTFHGVINMELKEELFTLPFLMYGMCLIAALIFYALGKLIWKDALKNILAFAASQGNAGYFGIPVAIILFGEEILGIYLFLWLGAYMFAFTAGYIIVAKGKHTLSESLRKFLKMPVIYAFIIALTLNSFGIEVNKEFLSIVDKFPGAFTILGMMILGLNLAKVKRTSLDWPFTIMAFIARFLFWPLFAALIIYIDKTLFHLYNETIYQLIFLISIVPIAADTVVFATEFRIQPQKVALTVFLSTIFALVFVPLMVGLWL